MKRLNDVGTQRPAQPFVLPSLESSETSTAPRLPSTVNVSQNAWLGQNFPRLMKHLSRDSRQVLPNTPLTLLASETDHGTMEVQIHIPSELTQDPILCRKMCSAIREFYGQMTENHVFGALTFSGDQTSARGVANFEVQTKSLEDLDALLHETMVFVKLMLVLDGNLDRLAVALSNADVFEALHTCFIGPRRVISEISGQPGSLHLDVSCGGEMASMQKGVNALVHAGFQDVALVVLSAMLQRRPTNHEGTWRLDALDLYVTLLSSSDKLLTNPVNANQAFQILAMTFEGCEDSFGFSHNFFNLSARDKIAQRCIPLFRALTVHGQSCVAFQLLEKLTGFVSIDQFVHMVDAMVREDPAPDTISRVKSHMANRMHHAMSNNARLKDLYNWLKTFYQQLDADIVLDSPALQELRELQDNPDPKDRKFSITKGRDGTGVELIGKFEGDKHGEKLVLHLETILTQVSDVQMIVTWGVPVLDFLIEHSHELPDCARRLLQACLPALVNVIGRADSAQADALISRVQRLAEASLLQTVLDSLAPPAESAPSLSRDRNVVAWAYGNRKTLFSELPTSAVDAAFEYALATVRLDPAAAQAFSVDVQAVSDTLAPKLAPMAGQVMDSAAIVASTSSQGAAGEAIFRCLKELAFMNDVQWQAKLLEKAGKIVHGAAQLPFVERMVQSAMVRLKAHLADATISDQDKLHLYGALVDFIRDAANGQAANDLDKAVHPWARKALDALAGDAALTQAMEAVESDAAKWPAWASVELKLGNEIKHADVDHCIVLLNTCMPASGKASFHQSDRVFEKAVELFTIAIHVNDKDKRQTNALKIYSLWVDNTNAPTLSSMDTVRALVRSLISSLTLEEDMGLTGAPAEEMLLALLKQLLQNVATEDEARQLMETSIAENTQLMTRCPLLGVKAYLMLTDHYRSMGGDEENEHAAGGMFAAAISMLPPRRQYDEFDDHGSYNLREEAGDLIRRFTEKN